jgi:glutaminyl-peptide cyclotransferase
MYRTQAVAAALTVLTVVCSGAPAQGPQINGELALKFTANLVKFGPRPAGSDAHAAMERYIRDQLKLFNCHTEEQAFTAESPLGQKPMRNFLVRIPGTGTRPIVISGHYDTKLLPNFVGANDGGSSAGMVMELARTLCNSRNQHDPVWLVLLDGEEAYGDWTETDSLYGSRWLAAKWLQDGTARRVKALINVDMIGDRDLRLLMDMNSSSQLREMFWSSARELGYGRILGNTPSAIEDDHIPFGKAGIPVLDVIDFDYGPNNSYWHTERDTVDKLSAASFQMIGETLLRVLTKLGEM